MLRKNRREKELRSLHRNQAARRDRNSSQEGQLKTEFITTEPQPDRNLPNNIMYYVIIPKLIKISRPERLPYYLSYLSQRYIHRVPCRQGTEASFIFTGDCTGGKGSSNSMATFPAY
eukprot:sb/3476484/